VQLRRDRGVGANSKEALIELRCKRRDELALPGRQRRWAAHHPLREQRQELGSLGLEGEEMHDLGDGDPRPPHLPEHRRVGLRRIVGLDAGEVHRLHSQVLPGSRYYAPAQADATTASYQLLVSRLSIRRAQTVGRRFFPPYERDDLPS
jgi:hypothetical protein